MAVNSYGGTAKHGELAGLAGDDHPQYSPWSQGLLAERPAAGRAGRFYYATDTGFTYYDLGTSWAEGISSSVPTTGGTMTGPLHINVENTGVGTAQRHALKIGSRTGLQAFNFTTGTALHISDNLYHDGTAWRYVTADSTYVASSLKVGVDGLLYRTAPAGGTADGAATITNHFTVSPTGGATIDGTTAALILGANTRPTNDSERLIVYASATQTQGVIQTRNNTGVAMFNVEPQGRVWSYNGWKVVDTRSTNPLPSAFDATGGYAARWDFKTASAIGLDSRHVGSNSFVGLQTFSPWGDDSGGGVYQLAFAPQGMFYRFGTRAGGWQVWRRIQDSSWGGHDAEGGYHSGMNNVSNHGNNLDNLKPEGAGFYDSSSPGTPQGSWLPTLHLRHYNTDNQYGAQLGMEMFGPRVWSRELNNGSFGAWKEIAHAVRGTYSGDATNTRHIACGFQPKIVFIYNGYNGTLHIGYHTDGLTSTHNPNYGYYMSTSGSNWTNSTGYRPYLQYDGFYIDASILNQSGVNYHYYALG